MKRCLREGESAETRNGAYTARAVRRRGLSVQNYGWISRSLFATGWLMFNFSRDRVSDNTVRLVLRVSDFVPIRAVN
jgi:hypothetical protein